MTRAPEQPAPVESRVATRADLPILAETMALAFYADPVWGWAFPDAERRLEQHRAVWGFLRESALDYGWVRIADAGAAALWIPPGRPELRGRRRLPLVDRSGQPPPLRRRRLRRVG